MRFGVRGAGRGPKRDNVLEREPWCADTGGARAPLESATAARAQSASQNGAGTPPARGAGCARSRKRCGRARRRARPRPSTAHGPRARAGARPANQDRVRAVYLTVRERRHWASARIMQRLVGGGIRTVRRVPPARGCPEAGAGPAGLCWRLETRAGRWRSAGCGASARSHRRISMEGECLRTGDGREKEIERRAAGVCVCCVRCLASDR